MNQSIQSFASGCFTPQKYKQSNKDFLKNDLQQKLKLKINSITVSYWQQPWQT